MKTAAEYRAMAEECFRWASEARTDAVRESYRQLAQVWLNTASKLDGLPPIRTSPMTDDVTKTTLAAGAEPSAPKKLTS
jgi:hypothetical protein